MSGEKISVTVHLVHIQDKTKIKLIACSPIKIVEEVAAKLSAKGKWNVQNASHITSIRIKNKKAHTEYKECPAEVSLVKGDELLVETNVPWVKTVKSSNGWGKSTGWGKSNGWKWNWNRRGGGGGYTHENVAMNYQMQQITFQASTMRF